MTWWTGRVLAISLLVFGLACRHREPIAAEVPAPAKRSAEDAGTAAPVAPETRFPSPPAAAAKDLWEPPPHADPHQPDAGSLRDLAARYVESDGQGGWRVNQQAATELEKIGPEGGERLVALMSDPQADVRRGVAYYLVGALDPGSQKHVQAVCSLLEDADAAVRGFAVAAARHLRREDQIHAASRLAALLDAGREARPENRAAAARLLGSLKSDAAAQLSALAAASRSDPDPKVRSPALYAVAQIAPPQQAAAILKQGLTDREASVRLVAAARLRQLGSQAHPAVKELAAALADADTRVAEAAAEALLAVGEPAVGPLAEQLAAESATARKYALACLAKIGPAAKAALPAIEKCRTDPDEAVRALAEAAAKAITAAGMK